MTLRFVPGFGIIGFAIVPIPKVTTPDEVIDAFPEFAGNIDSIKDPKNIREEQDAKDKLRKVAKRIVASQSSNRKIVGFVAHGHSDQMTRFGAGPNGDQLEQETSDDRAENCKRLLLQMIEEEGGELYITGIKANATTKGFGSKFRVYAPAATEPQMRKNRRVEIFLREFVDPPPSSPPPPTPPQSPRHSHKK